MTLSGTWLEGDVRYMVAHAGVKPEHSHYACPLSPLPNLDTSILVWEMLSERLCRPLHRQSKNHVAVIELQEYTPTPDEMRNQYRRTARPASEHPLGTISPVAYWLPARHPQIHSKQPIPAPRLAQHACSWLPPFVR